MSLLYQDTYLVNLFNFGEEGTDYTKLSDNVIESIPNAGYNYANGWTFGNQFNNYLTAAEDPEKWAKFEAFNAAARPLDSLGFVPDATELQTELTAAQAITEKYDDVFRGYSTDIEGDIERLKADYEAVGINTLIAEIQRQYDEWRALYK
jgi:putative aldouronate transport system substrate-binding protein